MKFHLLFLFLFQKNFPRKTSQCAVRDVYILEQGINEFCKDAA